MEEIILEVARRFVALDEREERLLRTGYLERSDRDYRVRRQSSWSPESDVEWHRSSWGESRFVNRVAFSPMPDWTFLVDELSIGEGSMIRYDRVNGRWRPRPNEPQDWYVRHDRLPVEVHGGTRLGATNFVVARELCDVVFAVEEAGLVPAGVAYASIGRRGGPHPLKEPPRPDQYDASLLTAEGRTAYLDAVRSWSESYLARCDAWARSVDVPERLPLDGDAYVHGDLRIPAELFDLRFLMTLLVGKLDALLKRLPPDNKYVAPAAR